MHYPQVEPDFGNPNGIVFSSPGLRGTSYPGVLVIYCTTPTEGVPKFKLIKRENRVFFEIFQNFIPCLREVQTQLYGTDGFQKAAALWFCDHGRGSEQCHRICQQTHDPS